MTKTICRFSSKQTNYKRIPAWGEDRALAGKSGEGWVKKKNVHIRRRENLTPKLYRHVNWQT